jgi:hypothetical protein
MEIWIKLYNYTAFFRRSIGPFCFLILYGPLYSFTLELYAPLHSFTLLLYALYCLCTPLTDTRALIRLIECHPEL